MNVKDPRELRNIGFFGHTQAGKTSLGEALLFASSAVDRLGKIADGNTTFDFETEEQRRQISLAAAFASADWKKCKLNVIDTPGDSNFFSDARSCMPAVDLVLLAIDAVDGIKVQTEKALQLAAELSLPLAVVINRMDKERANPEPILAALNKFGHAVPFTLPIGKELALQGVVDLLQNKASYSSEASPKSQSKEIPAELAAAAKAARDQIVEAVAECDDALTEKYLESGALSEEEIKSGLRKGLIARGLLPVFYTSATKLVGIEALLDFIVENGPTPLDHPAMKALQLSDKKEIDIRSQADAPLAALVFKSIVDPFAGQLTVFRIFRGQLQGTSQLYNSTRRERERFNSLLQLKGNKQVPLANAVCGEICAVAKLKATKTGDTFCEEAHPLQIHALPVASGVISFALKSKVKGEEEKIANGLARLAEEDPSIAIGRDQQTKDIMVTGMGQLHIEVILERLKRKFSVECTLEPPKIPYKETIRGSAKAQGKYKRQSGGRGQYGDCWLELKPRSRGKGFEFVDAVVGGVIPRQYIPAVEKGVVEAMLSGPQAGYPVVDLQVAVYDGSYHDVDSSEAAFKRAASMGFKKAFAEAKPCILEPIMKIEIAVPDEFMGDVIGDLNSRRGRVLGMDTGASGGQVIKGTVPMSEVLRYAPDLTSITSGRGSFTLEFDHYEELAPNLAEKIISERKAYLQKEEEE